jgi:hypothetical protein
MKHLLIYFYLLLSITAFSQSKKVVWDYPIVPGTEAWRQLKTEKDRDVAVQIPEQILKDLSAEDIVRLAITLPQFGYYSAYNTPQIGFNVMLFRFNIFNRLLSDEKACAYLVTVYEDASLTGFRKLSYPNDHFPIKLPFIELILSQKQVIRNLTSGDRLRLLVIGQSKLKDKLADETYKSGPNLLVSAKVLASILTIEDPDELKTLSNRQQIEDFADTGEMKESSLLQTIISLTDSYIK